MPSLKQTHYVREKFPDGGKSTIYYIDIRAIDRFEDFYQKVQADPTVTFIKSKVAKITEDESGNPVFWGVDTEGYKRYTTAHDLVVLVHKLDKPWVANALQQSGGAFDVGE